MMFTVLVMAAALVVVALLGYQVVSLRRQLADVSATVAKLSLLSLHPEPTPAVQAVPPPVRVVAGEHPLTEPVAAIHSLARPEVELVPTSRVASVTLGGPLIKVAAFGHGVRRALREEHRMRMAYLMRKELRRQQKLRRAVRRHRIPNEEWQS